MSKTVRCILVAGEPGGELAFYGPFGCEVDAIDWADRSLDRYSSGSWCVRYLESPDEEEEDEPVDFPATVSQS